LCADLLAYESSVAYLPLFMLFLCLGGWVGLGFFFFSVGRGWGVAAPGTQIRPLGGGVAEIKNKASLLGAWAWVVC